MFSINRQTTTAACNTVTVVQCVRSDVICTAAKRDGTIISIAANGVLMKDWAVVTLMAGEGTSVDGQLINGNGWQIRLNPGWKMVKVDALHYRLVK